jgi:sulfite reductase alpha subunit-like flavoprotein
MLQGTSEAYANELYSAVTEQNIDSELLNIVNISVKDLQSPNYTNIFILSCYGVGEPTDSTKKFYNELLAQDTSKPVLNNCQYMVFGVGSTRYDHYNIIGKEVDSRIRKLGGNRIFPLGLGDYSKDIFFVFERWKNNVVKHFSTTETDK